MAECSIFVDESGGQKGHSKYYGITLVFHDQSESIQPAVDRFDRALEERNLPKLTMHAGPLLNGHDPFEDMDVKRRKALLMTFFVMLQHIPVRYTTLMYRRSEFESQESLAARLRRDVINLLFDNLSLMQSFDRVKVFYDDGQEILAKALHQAIEYAISREAIVYKFASPTDYVLSQVADFLCTLELTALKYRNNEQTATDEKFFGSNAMFRRNFLKVMRRKRL